MEYKEIEGEKMDKTIYCSNCNSDKNNGASWEKKCSRCDKKYCNKCSSGGCPHCGDYGVDWTRKIVSEDEYNRSFGF